VSDFVPLKSIQSIDEQLMIAVVGMVG